MTAAEKRGLIPAHAGKTSSSRTGSVRCGAHPRSRGENVPTNHLFGRRSGSSPLTRGKLTVDEEAVGVGGLIPAHAGKTAIVGLPVAVSWAHPRSRGENYRSARFQLGREGSSPLTRGKRTSPPA